MLADLLCHQLLAAVCLAGLDRHQHWGLLAPSLQPVRGLV